MLNEGWSVGLWRFSKASKRISVLLGFNEKENLNFSNTFYTSQLEKKRGQVSF